MMSKCDNCRLRKESAKAFDIHWHGEDDCPYDKCPVPDFPKTNADRIRAMDSDQLIEWFCRGRPCGTCPYGGNVECSIRDWLKQEAES